MFLRGQGFEKHPVRGIQIALLFEHTAEHHQDARIIAFFSGTVQKRQRLPKHADGVVQFALVGQSLSYTCLLYTSRCV